MQRSGRCRRTKTWLWHVCHRWTLARCCVSCGCTGFGEAAALLNAPSISKSRQVCRGSTTSIPSSKAQISRQHIKSSRWVGPDKDQGTESYGLV
ncbi:hypothetical protein BKA63DRAFT_498664 [Paraphoma chrysanthemicola]|nr:hypothetical protein BKA63DRAFT_498664 [Paraphoma chrysanthemicola]